MVWFAPSRLPPLGKKSTPSTPISFTKLWTSQVAEGCGVQRHQACHKSHKSSLKSLSLGIFVGWIRFYLCSWIQHIKLGVENFYTIPQPLTHHRYPFKWPAVQDPTCVRLALLRMPVGHGHLWCQTSRGAICYLSTWKSSPKMSWIFLVFENHRFGRNFWWNHPSEKLWIESFSITFKGTSPWGISWWYLILLPREARAGHSKLGIMTCSNSRFLKFSIPRFRWWSNPFAPNKNSDDELLAAAGASLEIEIIVFLQPNLYSILMENTLHHLSCWEKVDVSHWYHAKGSQSYSFKKEVQNSLLLIAEIQPTTCW